MKLTSKTRGFSPSFFQFWKDRINAVRRNKHVIRQLLYLSLTNQYKKTFLGSVWLVLGPILSVTIWLILNYTGIYSPGETTVPYTGYLLLSMSIWIFFSNFFKLVATSVTESGSMLMEMPFDMEAKIVEKILLVIISFIIPFILNIFLLLFLGVKFSFSALLFFPTLVPLMLLGIAIGVFVSLIEVVFNDILLIASQGMTLLMYFTPVVYSDTVQSPFLQSIFKYNPITYLLGVPRNLLVGAPVNNWDAYWISSAFALLLFMVVIHFFFRSVYKIVERIFE
jgi:lipopolysaccharide transport system permease protein